MAEPAPSHEASRLARWCTAMLFRLALLGGVTRATLQPPVTAPIIQNPILQIDSLPVPDSIEIREIDRSIVLDSGFRLVEGLKGIYRDSCGVLVIPYSFSLTQRALCQLTPGEKGNEGEFDPRELTPQEKQEFLAQFDYLAQRLNLRFEEAKDPEQAYLTCAGANLEHYCVPGTNGYAGFPNEEGVLLVADYRVIKNSLAYFRKVVVHELGHVLGLRHPHKSSGYYTVLPEISDNINVTMMSYQNSHGDSYGGDISNALIRSKTPTSFQYYDWETLIPKYGLSPNFDPSKIQRLGGQSEVETLIGIGRPATRWVIDKNADAAFIDMNDGPGDVSSTGNAYYWTMVPVTQVTAENDKDNVFYGNDYDSYMRDGAGSSVFRPGHGRDVLHTGEGRDVIQVAAYSGEIIVEDYDPAKDIIEYDERDISRYRVWKYGEGSQIIFRGHGRKHGTVILPNIRPQEVGLIRPAQGRIVVPLHNDLTMLKPGEDRYINYPGQLGRAFDLQKIPSTDTIEISYAEGDMRWKFVSDCGEALATVRMRGMQDLDQFIYGTADYGAKYINEIFNGKITYRGLVPQPDGTILQSDTGGATIRKIPVDYADRVKVKDDEIVVLPNNGQTENILLFDGFLQRAAQPLTLSLGSPEYCGINVLRAQADTIKTPYSTLKILALPEGGAALISSEADGIPAHITCVNKVEGDLNRLVVEPYHTSAGAVQVSELREEELTPNLRAVIEQLAKKTAQQAELAASYQTPGFIDRIRPAKLSSIRER